MNLKTRAITILLLLALVCLACGYLTMRLTVLPQFEALERRQAAAGLDRARLAMERELFHLERTCRDWAMWDDTYRFMKDGNRRYVESNLLPGTFTDLRLAAMYFLDRDGRVVWGETRDANGRKMSPPDFAGRSLPLRGLKKLLSGRDSLCGLLRSTAGPMLFCASPVTDSKESLPPDGILFMARLLDGRAIAQMGEQALLPVKARLLPPGSRDRDRKVSFASGTITVSDTVSDYLGNPLLEITTSMPREASAVGRRTLRTVMFVSMLTAIALIVVSIRVMDRLVLSPLEAMSSNTGEDRNGELAAIAASRRDEIGRLAGKLAELEERWERQAQDEACQSWDSGAREMASGLLHNIRNAINPTVSDLSLLREELRAIPLANMRQAAAEIATARGERRRRLALYLERAMQIVDEFSGRVDERLQGLRSRCAEIEMMIAAHAGSVEHGARRVSSFPLRTLAEAAVEIIPARVRERITVELAPSLSRRVQAPRIELLQVVQNLVKNAAEAVTVAGHGSGRIVISAGEDAPGDGEGHFWIKVEDNGCGIEPADLEHIFRRDFSTTHTPRPGAGTGLHWCANVCRSLGGRITAESHGPGRGACFTVFMPKAPQPEGGNR